MMMRRRRFVIGIVFVIIAGSVLYLWLAREIARSDVLECAGHMRFCHFRVNDYVVHHDSKLPRLSGQDWVIDIAPYYRWQPGSLYCPSFKMEDSEWKAVNKAWGGSGDQTVECLALLRKRGIRLTSYELPKNVAGRSCRELDPDTIILAEIGPGHRGKHHFLLLDGRVVEH